MPRKNFVTLDASERDTLADALNKLWDARLIQENAQLHSDNFYNGIHFGPAFLPWHRDFLAKLEAALQSRNSNIFLPYWDWTRQDSTSIDISPWKEFFGGRSNSGGKFDHWSYTRNDRPEAALPTQDKILGILHSNSFTRLRGIEGPAHSAGHMWVGGAMAGGASPLDPLFYLHHGNVDRLWYIWQLNNSTAEQYSLDRLPGNDSVPQAFVAIDAPMIGGTTPRQVLDIARLPYGYDRDSDLEAAWQARFGTPLKTQIEPAIA